MDNHIRGTFRQLYDERLIVLNHNGMCMYCTPGLGGAPAPCRGELGYKLLPTHHLILPTGGTIAHIHPGILFKPNRGAREAACQQKDHWRQPASRGGATRGSMTSRGTTGGSLLAEGPQETTSQERDRRRQPASRRTTGGSLLLEEPSEAGCQQRGHMRHICQQKVTAGSLILQGRRKHPVSRGTAGAHRVGERPQEAPCCRGILCGPLLEERAEAY
jgi:hypothetical protein